MKKILVVLTGGTIGSKVEKEKIKVTSNSPYSLIHFYREMYGMDNEFEVIQPFSILSENMNLEYLTRLCQTMWNIPYEDYEGVILTHGSDTLSYTSALLGMLLCHVQIPVVLTASNYPLGEKKSNGLINFRSAVELIRTHLLKGVFCIYQDKNGENNVYLATRLIEADAYMDQFGSFGEVPFGKMEKGVFKYNADRINPTLLQIGEERLPLTSSSPCFEKSILTVRPYPGFDYRTIDLSTEPAAVLHYLYHSGTACTEGENGSILEFLKRCQKMRIPVYTASNKHLSGKNYETAKDIQAKGVIMMENISPEAAYAKLLLLYNMNINDVDKKVNETIYYENLPFPNDIM